MTICLTPATLSGRVTPPPSKSQSHRFLIAAALADGDSIIRNLGDSEDISATRRCLEELGAAFEDAPEGLLVQGMGANPMSPMRRLAHPHLDCGESGSTLRFLIPVALAVRGGGVFTGHGRLMERPLAPYATLFKEKGITFEQEKGVLRVAGLLEPGTFELPGDVSSQFFSGLLFALPLLHAPSAILPTTHLESEEYIALTTQALETFGVRTAATMSLPPQYHVDAPQSYQPRDVTVEGDWSQAGFWYAAKSLGHRVEVDGLADGSLQGDKVIADLFIKLSGESDMNIDLSGCPDLAPPLAVMAAFRTGRTTRLVNAGRLRAKESDRLAAVAQTLNALGGDVTEGADLLTIRGKTSLAGGVTVDSFHDHRIAMMTALAATRCQAPVTLTGAESVNKSYPTFWREYARLNGVFQEV